MENDVTVWDINIEGGNGIDSVFESREDEEHFSKYDLEEDDFRAISHLRKSLDYEIFNYIDFEKKSSLSFINPDLSLVGKLKPSQFENETFYVALNVSTSGKNKIHWGVYTRVFAEAGIPIITFSSKQEPTFELAYYELKDVLVKDLMRHKESLKSLPEISALFNSEVYLSDFAKDYSSSYHLIEDFALETYEKIKQNENK